MSTIDNKQVQTSSTLHHLRPVLNGTSIALNNGTQIYITKDNEVFMHQGEHLLPLSDPAAEALISRQHQWMIKALPRAIVGGVAAACFLIVTVWALDPYPQVQESVLGLYSSIGSLLVRAIGTIFVALMVYVFITMLFAGKGKKRTTQYIPFAKDGLVLIANSSEDDPTISSRLEQSRALLDANEGGVKAILFLRFQDPTGYFWNSDTPDRLPQFDRCEGSRKWDLPAKYQGRIFAAETWEEYQEYITTVEPMLRNQWLRARHQKANTPQGASDNLSTILKTATILLFLFFAPALFAQKSKQVAEYLGPERYEAIPGPVGEVRYVFAKAIIRRVGDGKFSHRQLLPDNPAYTDEQNAGGLLSITVAGERIYPQPKPTAAPAPVATTPPTPQPGYDPVRPRPLYSDAGPQLGPAPSIIPDSAATAAAVERMKGNMTGISRKIKDVFGEIWNGIMWVFWGVSSLLVGALGICRYVAKSAANESLVNVKGKAVVGKWIVSAQQNAAGMTLIITWIVVIIFLIDLFIIIIHFEWPLWIMVPIWFLILHFADRITDWLVPNPRMVKDRYT